jgi:hypothetical protein
MDMTQTVNMVREAASNDIATLRAHIIALEARVDAAEAMANAVQKEGAARGNYLGTPTDRGGHSGPKVQAKESWFAARCKMSDTLAAFRATGETP